MGPTGRRRQGVAELAEEFGRHRTFVTQHVIPRVLDESRTDRPLAYRVDHRGPVIFTEDVDAFMADQAIEWEGDFSWEEMAAAVNKEYSLPEGVPSREGVRLHCKITGWTKTRQRVLPYLSPDHFKARLAWAKKYLKQKYTAWVDIDDKWFYTVKLHGRRKQPANRRLPPRFCKSKRNIPKVMFLSAVARPRPGFNGIVGFWRVAEKYTAKKGSAYHDRDEVYDKDATMTADRYFHMMSTLVFPKIEKAFAGTGIREVIVQQSGGARPHTGKNVVDRLNELGTACSPRIVVCTQPAQSLDMNVNDLALFRAFDVAVRKLRRGMGRSAVWNKEQLVRDVMKAALSYPAEQLAKMWDYKSDIMEKVVGANGGNNYERHRSLSPLMSMRTRCRMPCISRYVDAY